MLMGSPLEAQRLRLWIFNLASRVRAGIILAQSQAAVVHNEPFLHLPLKRHLSYSLKPLSSSVLPDSGTSLQYSCLENPTDRGAWWAAVHGVAKSRTRLSNFHEKLFTFMHWRRKWQPTPMFLPGESQGWWEPGGLPSVGLLRVGHDWSDLAAAAAAAALPETLRLFWSVFCACSVCQEFWNGLEPKARKFWPHLSKTVFKMGMGSNLNRHRRL